MLSIVIFWIRIKTWHHLTSFALVGISGLLPRYLLPLGETHLLPSQSTSILTNWNVLARFDIDDNKKHMGLLLLQSKSSKIILNLSDSSKLSLKRKEKSQGQVISTIFPFLRLLKYKGNFPLLSVTKMEIWGAENDHGKSEASCKKICYA